MKVVERVLDGVLLLELKRFEDSRGYFMETYRDERYLEVGIPGHFRQDNISNSAMGTLRGLHFQNPSVQGKLVSVLKGSVFDVAVDIRKSSPTFGKWFGSVLSEANRLQMWVPAGFAHGFLTLENDTYFQYKCTDIYNPSAEASILWNDPNLGIAWPKLAIEPQLSPKDEVAPFLQDIPKDRLFS
jgi:dTDP-4-dehydrorhamnose 3,5-epimerase